MLAGRRYQRRDHRARHPGALRRRSFKSDSPMSSDRQTTVYVPCDSSALSLGANAVAEAIIREAARRHVNSEKGADSKRHAETNSIKLIRNGSRGLYWLEPMVEVKTARGRVAYGPVSAADVPSLFDAGFLDGRDHRLSLGLTEEI